MQDLQGKVAIITGAGRGLGRAEALGLAKRGARLVINDIDSPDAVDAAYATAQDITALGADVVVVPGDCADTVDADNVFKTALDTFGDVNIVINNAGFCRDKTLFAMTDDEFDSVVRVHLRGHFVNMRNATKYWREKAKQQGSVYGRLISTSSEASIFGSAGQPNYAAAKAGITAMTMGAAQLMIKYGVTCNVIMPRALTDMTNSGATAEAFKVPEQGFHAFAPENVEPLTTYLCSEQSAHISGEVFIVWGSEVKILQRPTMDVVYKNPRGDKWQQQDLHTTLSGYFDKDYVSVWSGYTVTPQ